MENLTGITYVSTEAEKKQFLEFPYQHYAGAPYWIPPLRMEQKKLLDQDKNPFFRNAEMACFIADRNGQPAGRIAAIIDRRFNEYHGTRTGFFGFFESIDSQAVTSLLLRVASDWLRERGMETLLGPASPGMMDEIGVLTEGFDRYPSIMMPYSKPYYDKQLKDAGLEKAMDMYAYEVDQQSVNRERMRRASDIVRRRNPNLVVRELNLRKIDDEIKIIRRIYNEAWKENWGFIPLTEAEMEALAADLKTIADTSVAHIAEINGKAVAFSVALPDYNQVFRRMNGSLFPTGILKLLWYRRKVDRIRTALMGVLPEYRGRGIDALLHQKAIDNKVGYVASELSWILESNPEMIRVAERIGATRTKTYRMYTMGLEG